MTDLTEENIWNLFNDINLNNSNKSDSENCNSCNSENSIVQDDKEGYLVCTNCGTINNELLDHTPEWNSFNTDYISSGRCGLATNFFLPKSSLGTTMAGSNYNRLKKLQNWGSMPYKERSLYLVIDEINTRCEKYGIKKNIIDDAKLMYKKISESKHTIGKNKGKYIIIRGLNRKSVIGACVFYACKLNNDTRSPKEIAKIFGLKITDITKGCKQFLSLIDDYNSVDKLDSSIPEHFVKRFCNALKIHKQYTEIALTIASNIKKLGIVSDHTPPSVAAGSILLMSKMNKLTLTKKSISNKFSISEVTISKIYNKIEEYRYILIDSNKTDQIINEYKNQPL
jgi:transcription initiation factor TFIIIB Brf1 subunit/transcription initiation factor TFIIB